MRISDWSSDVCSSDLFLPYKYDYRSEWLRFIRTVGIARSGYGELHERVVRAVATIVDSPGGLLFTLGDGRDFAPLAHWNMRWSEVRSVRSEEHTSELQSLMRISYAVFYFNKKTK